MVWKDRVQFLPGSPGMKDPSLPLPGCLEMWALWWWVCLACLNFSIINLNWVALWYPLCSWRPWEWWGLAQHEESYKSLRGSSSPGRSESLVGYRYSSDQRGSAVCIVSSLQVPLDFSNYLHTHCHQPHTVKEERELYQLSKREWCKENGEKYIVIKKKSTLLVCHLWRELLIKF